MEKELYTIAEVAFEAFEMDAPVRVWCKESLKDSLFQGVLIDVFDLDNDEESHLTIYDYELGDNKVLFFNQIESIEIVE